MIAAFATTTGAIADNQSNSDPAATTIAAIFGGIAGMFAFFLTMKEPGYYDLNSKKRIIPGIINVKRSSLFRTA